ncbi:Ark- serine/threonine protein kinase [Neonectria punicea]|uniref:non-specific serine/threonine protein kinase n=1 Tax=Neonectria punicea TaxID=979145 RepID=A0ABR1GGJ5_9HYPO
MPSHGHHPPPHLAPKHHHAPYGAPVSAPGPGAPAGTFAPGTKIQVGGHRVVIQKYLSEGGFAHVYLVKMPKPVDGTDLAVLKRVAVPDKEALRGMRIEVETMKRLKGHRPIVTYIDSHASELHGGGYEVFLLMEFCSGGGLIDFMNTRLQHRLTEPEILNIFTDIAEGVACMHYLKPALLHRDLKVENVLINSNGPVKRFKLCDFGSASPPQPAPTTVVECRLMDEDVQKHTTLQYRSPEMIDVYRKQPMNEKSDIWALGVLLYKLCYYTTPFEDQGQLAILNASYRFPSHPVFSDRLKKLIASMLKENMQARPTIYQVLKEGCAMQGKEVPIHDIYASRSHIESGRSETPSSRDPKSESTPVVGAVFTRAAPETQAIPEVKPMRRGRPTTTASPATVKPTQKQDPSPMRRTDGDPFAALDTKATPPGGFDELSSRFPTLDHFSLLHDQGSKFDFDNSPTSPQSQAPPADLNQRVTERLADQAFAPSQPAPSHSRTASRPHSVTPVPHQPAITSPPSDPVPQVSATGRPEISRAQSIISNNPELQAISSQSSSRYVSTGTMTATPPPEPYANIDRSSQRLSSDLTRSTSMPRQPEQPTRQWSTEDTLSATKPRVSSYQGQSTHVRHPSSSRPSLEGGRPRADFLEPTSRANPPVNRQRPASTNLESTTLDFLREKESAARPPSRSVQQPSPQYPTQVPSPRLDPTGDEDARLQSSDLDFLRSMEDSDRARSSKRSSLTSLSGNKNILAGKFGDAFKRFEGSAPTSSHGGGRTPSPSKDVGRRDLTPIAGSEATDGRSDDGHVHEDEDTMTPEMRREMERLQLLEEERRVAAGQAEYRRRVATGGTKPTVPPKSIGGVSRAVSIQNRVQSLLSEEQRPPSPSRTAQGYGKYTDSLDSGSKPERSLPGVPRKPLVISKSRVEPPSQSRGPMATGDGLTGSASAPPALAPKPPTKPVAPKKPVHLNSLPTGNRPASPPKQRQPAPSSEILVGMDLPGRPVIDMTAREKDDYIQDFSKRFPSLGSIEMVERDIGSESGRTGR